MVMGLCDDLRRGLLSSDQHHCGYAGNDGCAYGLHIAKSCQQDHTIIVSREQVAHEICRSTSPYRNIHSIMANDDFCMQKLFDNA